MVHPVWYIVTLGVAIGTVLFAYLNMDNPDRPQEYRRPTGNSFYPYDSGESQSPPCSICLNTMHSNQMLQLNCGHSFHKPCIDKWFSTSGNLPRTCPNCRKHV